MVRLRVLCSNSKPRSAVRSTSNLAATFGIRNVVLEILPAEVKSRLHLVTDEDVNHSWVDTCVYEDAHTSCSIVRVWPSSRNAWTCSRDIEGYTARNSSMVSPVSRKSISVWTGTRVPVKHGVPCMISLSILIALARAPFCSADP